jgi:protein O-mannosyl-transferase
MQSPGERSSNRRRTYGAAALLVVLTVAAYLPALGGGFLWDDDQHVTRPDLQPAAGLYRIWFNIGATQQYYPLLHTAFWLEHRLWGDNTLGYHLVNVLLHVAAALLVYLILRRLKIPGALLAATIFAVHPVEVESVAWISEQKNTLSAVFYLGAALTYLRFDETRMRSAYGLALALFVLGLLTKTVTATLPAALLVIFWWQRGSLSWRKDVWPLVPFFLCGAVAAPLTAWVERKLIGAEGAAFELSFLQRSLLAGRVIWFYLSKLAWPTNLIFFYPRWNIEPAAWWQWLFPLATLATLAILFAISKRWRAPLAGMLFFVGTLFPVLGFLNVYPFIFSFVADHFQYLASLGVITLAASGITLAVGRLPRRAQWAGHLASGALVAVLALMTFRQSRIYGDAIDLYQTTLERNPTSWIAYNNLGVCQNDAKQREAALDSFQKAIEINPNFAEAHNNLGAAFARRHKYTEALEQYREALRIRPKYPKALANYGEILVLTGKPKEAVEQYEQALALDPGFTEVHRRMAAVLLIQTHETQRAIEHFETALRQQPGDADTHANLANALLHAGKLEPAIQHSRIAIQLKPDHVEAHHNLGIALLKAGRPAAAGGEFEATLRLAPEHMQAYFNLTKVYQQLQQPEKAGATVQKAEAVARAAGNQDLADRIEAWAANPGSPPPAVTSPEPAGAKP